MTENQLFIQNNQAIENQLRIDNSRSIEDLTQILIENGFTLSREILRKISKDSDTNHLLKLRFMNVHKNRREKERNDVKMQRF